MRLLWELLLESFERKKMKGKETEIILTNNRTTIEKTTRQMFNWVSSYIYFQNISRSTHIHIISFEMKLFLSVVFSSFPNWFCIFLFPFLSPLELDNVYIATTLIFNECATESKSKNNKHTHRRRRQIYECYNG